MASETVKLLGSWASPVVLRARIAFNIKSVAYEFLEENFAAKSDLLLKSNPLYKKVPVIIHNQNPVCESLIIVQYIDEVWTSGPAIMPAHPYDRAINRFWATYIDDTFQLLYYPPEGKHGTFDEKRPVTEHQWFPKLQTVATAQDEEAKKAAIGEVEEGLGVLEGAFQSCSKGKKFFGGERMGLLDIALGCFMAWIRVTETFNRIKFLDEAKVPGLANWAEDFCADDAVKDVMPSTEKLAEFAMKIFTHMKPQS